MPIQTWNMKLLRVYRPKSYSQINRYSSALYPVSMQPTQVCQRVCCCKRRSGHPCSTSLGAAPCSRGSSRPLSAFSSTVCCSTSCCLSSASCRCSPWTPCRACGPTSWPRSCSACCSSASTGATALRPAHPSSALRWTTATAPGRAALCPPSPSPQSPKTGRLPYRCACIRACVRMCVRACLCVCVCVAPTAASTCTAAAMRAVCVHVCLFVLVQVPTCALILQSRDAWALHRVWCLPPYVSVPALVCAPCLVVPPCVHACVHLCVAVCVSVHACLCVQVSLLVKECGLCAGGSAGGAATAEVWGDQRRAGALQDSSHPGQ